jgi:hypothetical protein
MQFIYHDNSKTTWEMIDQYNGHWVAPVVFSCEADDILEADAKFEKAIGCKPLKFGCEIVKAI